MKYNPADFSFERKTEPFIFDLDSLFYHLDCLTDGRKPKGVRYPLSGEKWVYTKNLTPPAERS